MTYNLIVYNNVNLSQANDLDVEALLSIIKKKLIFLSLLEKGRFSQTSCHSFIIFKQYLFFIFWALIDKL